MNIKGFISNSLIDWDGHFCAVLFVDGCNFRCPWCHNAPLVLLPENLENLKIENIMAELKELGKVLEAVCITGGEPSLWPDLKNLCKKLKKLGLKIKVDTNGINPPPILIMIDKKIIDYVAVDIKAPLSQIKYSQAIGRNVEEYELSNIASLCQYIMKSNIDYEFRTTIVPAIHTPKDIEQICKYLIKGAKKYVIQNFRPCDTLINPKFKELKPFTLSEFEAFVKAAEPYVQTVKFRNI